MKVLLLNKPLNSALHHKIIYVSPHEIKVCVGSTRKQGIKKIFHMELYFIVYKTIYILN